MPWDDAVKGGSLIGQKLILNEFVAHGDYIKLEFKAVIAERFSNLTSPLS